MGLHPNGFQDRPVMTTSVPLHFWSSRRDLNPRPSPWQGDALPLSHYCIKSKLVRVKGFEPSRRKTLDPKSSASANSAIPACNLIGGSNRARTCDPLLVRQMLSQLSYTPKLMIYCYVYLRHLQLNRSSRTMYYPSSFVSIP